MKTLDAAVILAFVLIDDLRNLLLSVLVGSDATTLAIMLIVVYFVSRNQKALGSLDSSLESLKLDLAAPFKRLKGSLDF
ncbi:MAG: hypothetical protein V1817_05110 [Candidatus Micrarchaeota archaeon]